MKTENKAIVRLFSASGICALVSIFIYLVRIITQMQAEFNVYCVLVMELLCFLTITILLCEHKSINQYLTFVICYLFLSAVILLYPYPYPFLFYTEPFFLISIGLISFLSWLNALVFYLLHDGQ